MKRRAQPRSNLLTVSVLILSLALMSVMLAYAWALKQQALVRGQKTCVRRARFIARALERYALDHEGVLPFGWEGLTGGGYLRRTGEFYRCPLDKQRYQGEPSFDSTSYEVRWGTNLLELDEGVERSWQEGFDLTHYRQLLIYHNHPDLLATGHGHPRGFRELSVELRRTVRRRLGTREDITITPLEG